MKLTLKLHCLIGINLCFLSLTLWANEIRVTDYSGKDVVLTQPASRIIALSPHVTENIFAAGAGDLLVGAVEYSDYPVQAKAITRIGSFASLNREALLALKPDLVIAWGSGNGEAMIQQIRDLGIPVFTDEPQDLKDIARSLRVIGQLSGREKTANLAANKFLHQLNMLQSQFSQQKTVSVFYQIWHSPIQTVNQDHIITKVIELCGGRNAFGDAIPAAPIINRETVIARDPEIIIASGDSEKRPTWLDHWQQWPSLQAVRNDFLFVVPPDYLQRHTPRILVGVEMVCKQLEMVRVDLTE